MEAIIVLTLLFVTYVSTAYVWFAKAPRRSKLEALGIGLIPLLTTFLAKGVAQRDILPGASIYFLFSLPLAVAVTAAAGLVVGRRGPKGRILLGSASLFWLVVWRGMRACAPLIKLAYGTSGTHLTL